MISMWAYRKLNWLENLFLDLKSRAAANQEAWNDSNPLKLALQLATPSRADPLDYLN